MQRRRTRRREGASESTEDIVCTFVQTIQARAHQDGARLVDLDMKFWCTLGLELFVCFSLVILSKSQDTREKMQLGRLECVFYFATAWPRVQKWCYHTPSLLQTSTSSYELLIILEHWHINFHFQMTLLAPSRLG